MANKRVKTKDQQKKEGKTPRDILLSAIKEVDPSFVKSQYAKKTKKDLEHIIITMKKHVDDIEKKLEARSYHRITTLEDRKTQSQIFFRSTKAGNLAGEHNTVKPFERFKNSKKDLRDQIKELANDSKDTKELINKLCDASDSIDPIAFHVSLMNGYDPRVVSAVASMLDIILYDMNVRGDILPNLEEWEILTDIITHYYAKETVSMSDSLRAAGELLSVSTPRLKQVEQTVTAPPSKLEGIGINPEAIKALPKEDAKHFLRIIKAIKEHSLNDESEE